jgi:hypothetical protein
MRQDRIFPSCSSFEKTMHIFLIFAWDASAYEQFMNYSKTDLIASFTSNRYYRKPSFIQ